MSEQDQLHELDWVLIPNEPYIMKYAFSDTGYNIIVSNLTFLYNEKLEDTSIQKRFCKLNPFAQMKSQVILENLKKSFQKCLTEKSDFNMRFDANKLVITLKFPVAHVLCNYDIEMELMAAEKVMQFVISPTVFGALLSQRKVLELQKRTSLESTRSSVSSNISVPSQHIIEPEWLKGQNVPIEAVLDSFLKFQSHFKDLYTENYEAYCLSKKEKKKNSGSLHCATSQKKCRLQDNIKDESTNVKFEDAEQSISIKEESISSTLSSEASNAILSQPSKNNVKKKKAFKI